MTTNCNILVGVAYSRRCVVFITKDSYRILYNTDLPNSIFLDEKIWPSVHPLQFVESNQHPIKKTQLVVDEDSVNKFALEFVFVNIVRKTLVILFKVIFNIFNVCQIVKNTFKYQVSLIIINNITHFKFKFMQIARHR